MAATRKQNEWLERVLLIPGPIFQEDIEILRETSGPERGAAVQTFEKISKLLARLPTLPAGVVHIGALSELGALSVSNTGSAAPASGGAAGSTFDELSSMIKGGFAATIAAIDPGILAGLAQLPAEASGGANPPISSLETFSTISNGLKTLPAGVLATVDIAALSGLAALRAA